MRNIYRHVLLLYALANIPSGQERENEWLLPNLDSRLSVQVSNPGKAPARALATLAVTEARKVAPEFPGRLAFALLVGKPGESRPATFLPSQADDLDVFNGGSCLIARRGCPGDCPREISVQIVMGDPSRRSGATHLAQVDDCLARAQSNRGCS